MTTLEKYQTKLRKLENEYLAVKKGMLESYRSGDKIEGNILNNRAMILLDRIELVETVIQAIAEGED